MSQRGANQGVGRMYDRQIAIKFPAASIRLWGPPNHHFTSPEVRRQVREADHSLPPTAEICLPSGNSKGPQCAVISHTLNDYLAFNHGNTSEVTPCFPLPYCTSAFTADTALNHQQSPQELIKPQVNWRHKHDTRWVVHL